MPPAGCASIKIYIIYCNDASHPLCPSYKLALSKITAVMEDLKKIENLFDHARDYINIRVDEAKLSIAEKASGIAALVIATTVVNVIFLLALIFAGAAGAVALGQWLDNYWLGFLLVAGLYLLAGLFVWAARDRLIRIPVMNAIIRQLFKNEDDEKD